jgi:hypothetical protein
MATKIQVRRDTSANWTSLNPTLSSGEIGYETNTGKFKIGNGSTLWSSLDYFLDSSDLSGYLTASSASTTYLAQASASTTYLTQSSASTTYQPKVANVDNTEIGYLNGVTSLIQTQIDSKLNRVDGSVTTATASASVVRNITLSTSSPTGGNDGDVWMVYS